MTVSISRMSINYYLSSIATGDRGEPKATKGQLTSYYMESGDPNGTWYGSGLVGIGLNPEDTVTKKAAIALYEDLADPTTGKRLGKDPMKKTEAPAGAKTPRGFEAKKDRQSVAGFDLTFSVPKSVSALWAVADAGTQAQIHAAHQRAVRTCLDWAEENIIQSRAGHGGIAKVPVRGIMASLFDHFDSRQGDPQLHTHAVVSNRVQRVSDGRWVTLDSYTLHRWVVATSELYNAALSDELGTSIGAVAEQRDPLDFNEQSVTEKNRRVELVGVPEELIAEFSTRSVAIEARKQELIAEWLANHDTQPSDTQVIKFRQQATLETREAKPQEKDPLFLRVFEWRQRAHALGLNPTEIVRAATGRDPETVTAEQLTEDAREELAAHVLTRASEKHPTFTRANLAAAAHRLLATVRFDSFTDRTALAEDLAERAIENAEALTPERYRLDHLTQDGLTLRGHSVFDRPEDRKYTTTATLAREADLMDAADRTGAPALEDRDAARDLLASYTTAKGFHLAPDQQAAAHQAVTSGTEISAIIGPAGTGKTTTLAGVRHAWEDTHGPGSIIGLAPSAAAAAVLSDDLGIPTDNVAKWLYETVGDGAAHRAQKYQDLSQRLAAQEARLAERPNSPGLQAQVDATRTKLAKTITDQSKYTLQAGQMVIVDESSMASTSDLHQLHTQAAAAGAKLLLVGDPRQLDPVEEGGFLGWMENTHRSANLTSIFRFTADWEAEASLKLRTGRPDVLNIYADHGRISVTTDALDSAYRAWQADTAAGKSSVLIAGRNDQVQALNQRAQTDLLDAGTVDPTASAALCHGGTAYLNDVVLARRNDRRILDENGEFIKNGSRLRITGIDNENVTATREDTGAKVTLSRVYLAEHVELGYASTAHRAQGLTVDTAHVAADETFSREQLYVAMTRGRDTNQVHVNESDQQDAVGDSPDPWKLIQPIAASDPMDMLTGVLSKTTADTTAHEKRDAEHGWAHDLGRYSAELEYISTVSATRRTYDWVRETLGAEPEEFSEDPELKQLVTAVKSSEDDFDTLPKETVTIQEAIVHFQGTPRPAARWLIPPTEHTTPEEAEAQQQVLDRLQARVAQIQRTDAEEPWLVRAQVRHPHAVQAIIQWRAISGQEDAETILGDPPRPEEKRLVALYERLQSIIGDNLYFGSEEIPSIPEVPSLEEFVNAEAGEDYDWGEEEPLSDQELEEIFARIPDWEPAETDTAGPDLN